MLQVDGYSGYNEIGRSNRVQLAYCWAHVRRGFYEIAASRPVAAEALVRIAQLYAIAGDPRPLARRAPCRASGTERARRRRPSPVPRHQPRQSQQEGQARRRDPLCAHPLDRAQPVLDDGRVEIDSNTVERSIRPLALNRKNALFAGSDDGGDHWATIASMIETCKLNGINPQIWLDDTLTRLAAGHSANALDQLMPWNHAAIVM